MKTQMDQRLLSAWQAGDARAGAELLATHVGAIYRFFRRRDEAAADDLTQRTMLTIVESHARMVPRDSVRAYLLGIARHVWMAQLSSGRAARQHRSNPASQRGVSTHAALREQRGRLVRALRTLPLTHQLPLELHYWEELTTREIAEVLDVPVGTIKWRLAQARRALRRALDRMPAVLEECVTAQTTAWRDAMRRELGVTASDRSGPSS